jgi:hypothetical protein
LVENINYDEWMVFLLSELNLGRNLHLLAEIAEDAREREQRLALTRQLSAVIAVR